MKDTLVLATRRSPMALWQANRVKKQILLRHPEIKIDLLLLETAGDKWLQSPLSHIGGKGLFLKELEQALLLGLADCAVHSVKDVPCQLAGDFNIAAYCQRDEVRDAFVSLQYEQLSQCPKGAIVGSSSLRRQAQLYALNSEIVVKPLRGNVNTRLSKLTANEYDAIILSAAGLLRLNLSHQIKRYFPVAQFLPAIGQGGICVETRRDNMELNAWLQACLDHQPTRLCIEIERSLGQQLQAGCHSPVAGFCDFVTQDTLRLRAKVASPCGRKCLNAQAWASIDNAQFLAERVSQDLFAQGARQILDAGEWIN